MLQTIRARLVALVLAVALPLFGVLAWAFWAEIARVHNSARDLALRIAVSIASDVRSSNRHSRGVLQQMAQRLKTQNSGPGGCDAYFGIIDFYPPSNIFGDEEAAPPAVPPQPLSTRLRDAARRLLDSLDIDIASDSEQGVRIAVNLGGQHYLFHYSFGAWMIFVSP